MNSNLAMFISALGLLCVFEGIMPFLSPKFYRQVMQQMLLQDDQTLHRIGLISMIIGLVIIAIVHQL